MATPPPSAKQFSPLSLLMPIFSLLLLLGLLFWQRYSLHSNVLPPEIVVAQQALKKNDANSETAARQQFDLLIKKSPLDAALFNTIMTVCALEKRFALSLEYGELGLQACKYNSNTDRASLLLTMSATFTRAHEAPPQPQALAYVRRALELDPDNPEVLNGYGYILVDNARTVQEVNRAIGYINRALQFYRTAKDANALQFANTEDCYGWALYKLGKYDAKAYARAADALTTAIDDMQEGTPGEIQKEFYYHLGSACRAAGRIEEARHALQISLFYDPKFEAAVAEWKALPPLSVNAPAKTIIPEQNGTGTSVLGAAVDKVTTPPAASIPTQTPDGKPLFQPLTKPSDGRKAPH